MSNFELSRRTFIGLAAYVYRVSAAVQSDASASGPASSFAEVPNAYRMRMHWYIFGPAWTSAEARRQMELMVKAHVGGVLVFPTYPIAIDNPAKGIKNEKYLSPEFLSVFKSVVADAKTLGLTVDIVLGTGWPYGGPSVSLEESVHSIRMTRMPVSGQVRPPELRQGETPIAAFLVNGEKYERVQPSGSMSGQPGEIQWFYSAPTRMEVKRAAWGAEGWIIDHYSKPATEQFVHDVGDKLLDSVPRGSVRSIFCDSFEVYRATWTADFPAIFQRKRGYDLVSYLPALFNSVHPDSKDLRVDFWRTLSEQAEEAFVAPLQQWAHSKGVTTQVEAYGTPPVSIASYRYVDVPTGEHYEWKEFNASRWASSGGHLAGKPVILAEAWTWLGLPNRFADTLEQLKLCSDLHFLSGINSLYGVTYAYSPIDLGSPGWVPYFGPATNHTSPYWPYFSHFADYVNRASYILQQGKPVADVALYLPDEDSMAEADTERLLLNWAVRDRMSSNGPPPEFSLKNALHYESDVVKEIITNGYSFDGVDMFTMNGGMRADGGRLLMGDGSYSILVLPNLTGIEPESLDVIEKFVSGGGTLIATRRLPERAYGLKDRENRSAQVRERIARIFGSNPRHEAYRENRYGRGMAILCMDEQGSFRKALQTQLPDIVFDSPSEHVSFVHRKTTERDFYFVANTSENTLRKDAVFRTRERTPELWELKTGRIEPIVLFEPVADGTRVSIELGPRESKVIAFTKSSRVPVGTHSELPLGPNGAKAFRNGSFTIRKGSDKRRVLVSGIPAAYALNISWKLTLGDHSLPLNELKSWTEMPDVRFFSGRGVYQAEFPAPDFSGLGVELDLGRVHETADVRLNDQPVGVAWMRPYRLDVTQALRKGNNRIQVDVTNLLINQILGMGPIDYSEVFAKFGRRFPAGEEWDVIREPLPSGLLGPVTLVFYKRVQA